MTALVALGRREPVITAFTTAHVVTLTAVGVALDRRFVWIYFPLMLASIAAVVIIDRRAGPMPRSVLWALSIWAMAHLAGGLLGDPSGEADLLYNWWLVDGVLRFDQVVHGYGIAVATLAIASVARSTPIRTGFVWGQLIGAGNEAVENVFAALVEGSNVGDGVNTLWDLAFHLIGGVAAVVIMRRWVCRGATGG